MMARRIECSEGYVEPGLFTVNHLVKYWLATVDVKRGGVHVFGIDATSAFSSNRPLNLRAGEANVLELPVAHCLQLEDRYPLDATVKVGHPPRFQSGDRGVDARPDATAFSCRHA